MNFSSNYLHWSLWILGSAIGFAVLHFSSKADEKLVFEDKAKRNFLYWLKRGLLQIILTSACIGFFLFSPVSCTRHIDQDCQTEFDKQGAYSNCR